MEIINFFNFEINYRTKIDMQLALIEYENLKLLEEQILFLAIQIIDFGIF